MVHGSAHMGLLEHGPVLRRIGCEACMYSKAACDCAASTPAVESTGGFDVVPHPPTPPPPLPSARALPLFLPLTGLNGYCMYAGRQLAWAAAPRGQSAAHV